MAATATQVAPLKGSVILEQGIHTYPAWEESKHHLSGLFCLCLPDITSVEGQDHILRPIVSHRRLEQ